MLHMGTWACQGHVLCVSCSVLRWWTGLTVGDVGRWGSLSQGSFPESCAPCLVTSYLGLLVVMGLGSMGLGWGEAFSPNSTCVSFSDLREAEAKVRLGNQLYLSSMSLAG